MMTGRHKLNTEITDHQSKTGSTQFYNHTLKDMNKTPGERAGRYNKTQKPKNFKD